MCEHISEGKVYLSNPPLYKCKLCGSFYRIVNSNINYNPELPNDVLGFYSRNPDMGKNHTEEKCIACENNESKETSITIKNIQHILDTSYNDKESLDRIQELISSKKQQTTPVSLQDEKDVSEPKEKLPDLKRFIPKNVLGNDTDVQASTKGFFEWMIEWNNDVVPLLNQIIKAYNKNL